MFLFKQLINVSKKMTEENKPKDGIQTENKDTETTQEKTDNNSYGSGLVVVNTIIIVVLVACIVLANNSGFFDKYAKSKAAASEVTEVVVTHEKQPHEEDKVHEFNASSEWITPHISKQAKIHILYGDETGGAHFHTVTTPCKSIFPKTWDADKIIQLTEKIAAGDNLDWKARKNGNMFAQIVEDGILVRVIMDAQRKHVITSYPLNAGRTPCPKDNNKAQQLNKEDKIINSAEGTSLYNVLNSMNIKTKHHNDYNQ